jgi:hypothetical protein
MASDSEVELAATQYERLVLVLAELRAKGRAAVVNAQAADGPPHPRA